ncbi:hypothetical protein H072_2280 [Dactylellina haptotyla CBS 200.50]|uniref:BPL/LPL catalytic domain-containing protein n=1 Tax=Dactylellina haptotyla (strain CBS 200.50) TaxID=1284197 RepID=S8BW63_DACHA|nr:hypothetical protein H072_2280 [Dactylellina haptotyla CBS 200.50]
MSTCALLCLPGGADLGFCKALNGTGNRRIKEYVRRGGKFLGFCAGAYFGSSDIEFEKGEPSLEVAGSRELAFFPGSCHGATYKGFRYNSELGARACRLDISKRLLDTGAPARVINYYNGGGIFVDAEKFGSQGVEILARYHDEPDIPSKGNVAAVGCRVGAGYAFLIGTHPEFAPTALSQSSRFDPFPDLIGELEAGEMSRLNFFSSILKLLDLKCNNGERIPSFSDLHLSCANPVDIQELLEKIIGTTDFKTPGAGCPIIIGESNIFTIQGPSISQAIDGSLSLPTAKSSEIEKVKKQSLNIKIYDSQHPTIVKTPYFDVSGYFEYLMKEHARFSRAEGFGSPLLYGEVVSSTNTLLEKNFKFLQHLPSGFTVVAAQQTAGRGRGDNVWVSPIGALIFSTVVRQNSEHNIRSPVVFVQYIAALAIVLAIKSYGPGYENIPVHIKWPNDIYAGYKLKDGDHSKQEPLTKIGGILVNASFAKDEFILIVGCGINTTNDIPTTSLKRLAELAEPPLPAFEQEKLLAKILATFQTYYQKFVTLGFRAFENEYYQHWLHSNQIVTLENADRTTARIQGISMEDGMLLVNEVDDLFRNTGRTFKLQTDGNSFDFFKGLLRKKV